MLKKSGIYKISNTSNGKVYIGKTSETFKRRFERHTNMLIGQKHHNKHLQNAWNSNKDDFMFEILEIVEDVSELNDKEKYWINEYKSADCEHGYNKTYGGDGGTINIEARKRKSESMLGEKNHFYGKTHNAEARIKISEAGKNRPCSNETRSKRSIAMKGLKRSEENRKNLSKARKGIVPIEAIEKRIVKVVQIDINNKFISTFNSISDASRNTNANIQNIQAVCSGKRRTAGGFKWMYYKEYIKAV